MSRIVCKNKIEVRDIILGHKYSNDDIIVLDFTDASDLFGNFDELELIPQLDTSKVTNMSGMFYNCSSLQSIPQLDTSKVTNMSGMFSDCSLLKSIPQLDTSKVTNMSGMFYCCSSLESIPKLNTIKVIIVADMFDDCWELKRLGYDISDPKSVLAKLPINWPPRSFSSFSQIINKL